MQTSNNTVGFARKAAVGVDPDLRSGLVVDLCMKAGVHLVRQTKLDDGRTRFVFEGDEVVEVGVARELRVGRKVGYLKLLPSTETGGGTAEDPLRQECLFLILMPD